MRPSETRSLAPKRSINCGSQWFAGSLSTCLPTRPSPPLTGSTFLVTSADRLRTYPSNTGCRGRDAWCWTARQTSPGTSCPRFVPLLTSCRLSSLFFFLCFSCFSGLWIFSEICFFSHHFCCKWLNYWLVSTDERCPSLPVEDWRFPQAARRNITGKRPEPPQTTATVASFSPHHFLKMSCLASGFNLVRRFSLLKSADVKKIRNPRGPVILRLGKTALLRPTEYVAPNVARRNSWN